MKPRTPLKPTHHAFFIGLIGWAFLVASPGLNNALSQDAGLDSSGASVKEQEAREREIDREHFRQILTALQAYRKDHGGEWPDWLSDLMPRYLADPKVLVSPTETRTGRTALFGMRDPKGHTSYTYEFNAMSAAQHLGDDVGADFTMKKWKTKQMELWGAAVPVVRCHLYQPVLGLTASGDIIETGTVWESDVQTLELMKRLGATNSPPDWRSLALSLVDADNGQPLVGAEVRVASSYLLGSLPVQVMTTDAKGETVIRLPKEKVTSLRIVASSPGYVRQESGFGEDEEALRTLPQIKLAKGVAIRGVVRTESGQPVAKAKVELRQPEQEDREPLMTDAEGQWTMDGLPATFGALVFEITHPEFRTLSLDVTSTNAAAILRRRSSVRGTVEDSETHEPVENFVAVCGYEYFRAIRWDVAHPVRGRAGKFAIKGDDMSPCAVRIQAKGYQPRACAPFAETEGERELKFELLKVDEIVGEVVTADGQPAADAAVTLLLESGGVTLGLGKVAKTDGSKATTDTEGRFVLPFDPEAHSVVAVHEGGFAVADLAKVRASRKIALRPWARVVVPAPAQSQAGFLDASVVLTADVFLPAIFQCSHLGAVALDFDQFARRISGPDEVTFSFVPPGRRVVWRPVLLDTSWGSSPDNMCYNGVEVEAVSGEATGLDAGSGTVSVAGKLVNKEVVDWAGFLGRLAFRPEETASEREVLFTIHTQGRFRIDGLPAKASSLSLSVYRPPILFGTGSFPIGSRRPRPMEGQRGSSAPLRSRGYPRMPRLMWPWTSK